MILSQAPLKHADDASVVTTKGTKSVKTTANKVSNENNVS